MNELETITEEQVGEVSDVLGDFAEPTSEGPEIDLLETEGTSIPLPTSDAHRGTISSISTKENQETGSVTVLVALESTDTAQSHTLKFWPPREFFSDAAWVDGFKGVGAHMPTEVPEGKKQSPSNAFARNVISKTAAAPDLITDSNPTGIHLKDGVIQRILKIAKADGRTLKAAGVTKAPTNGFEFIEALNLLTANLPVVYKRRPGMQDDEPTGFLEVSELYPVAVLDDPKADTRYFKGILKQWEVTQ